MKRLFALFIATAISIGAGAATLLPIQLLNPVGSTSGQAILSTGAPSAPAWGGVPVGGLAAIAANTVIGNATGSSAIPTAVTVTGCNGAAQALQWTNGSGFGCNSSIATSGANSNITSLSALVTPLSVAQGGTGAASAPTALTALGAAPTAATFGVGQTFTNMTGSRAFGTTYTNSTGKPICIYVLATSTAVSGQIALTISGTAVGPAVIAPASSQSIGLSAIIPPGLTYSVGGALVTLITWFELR